jgi:rod shape determining protein RodA
MRSQVWRHFDFWLLGAVVILVIFGVIMIRSAVAGNIELTETTPLVQRQIIFAIAGLVVMLVMAAIDYHLWAAVNRGLYLGIIIVLLALNIIGGALFGSARWFQTTLVFIQPSEFAKIVLILTLAYFFARHLHEMNDPKWTIRSFLLTMGITTWIILQPNLSTSIVTLVLWFALLWLAGVPVKHLMAYAVVGTIVLAVTLPILIENNIIQEYQMNRVMTFLAPPEDASYGDTYNIEQAAIAIGSGGLFGMGYGLGSQVQNRFLKVRWSDFIFSATAHEFGLVGAMLVILLVLFIVWRCFRAARIAQDPFGSFIAYGVATLISFQAAVNIGVNLNMMPATGLTLPFLSYGGSSLVANLIAIGLVESVIMRHKALEF